MFCCYNKLTLKCSCSIKSIIGPTMKTDIPSEVLEATKDCPQGFACLLTDGQCGDPIECKVDYALKKNVLFLESKIMFPCPYRKKFGYRVVCHCPVHFYLFKNDIPINK